MQKVQEVSTRVPSQTRQERLESALYLRLKRCKVFKIVKEEVLFGFFETSVCCKISNKLKGGPFGDTKSKKVAQC